MCATENEGVQDILESNPTDRPGWTGLILRLSGEAKLDLNSRARNQFLTSTIGAISGLRVSDLAPAFPET